MVVQIIPAKLAPQVTNLRIFVPLHGNEMGDKSPQIYIKKKYDDLN